MDSQKQFSEMTNQELQDALQFLITNYNHVFEANGLYGDIYEGHYLATQDDVTIDFGQSVEEFERNIKPYEESE